MKTFAFTVMFLCAGVALAVGSDAQSQLLGEKEQFGPPEDANAIVLGDIFGVCLSTHISGVRKMEVQGDMVRGSLSFEESGQMVSVSYDLGPHYGFGDRASKSTRIVVGDQSRRVRVLEEASRIAYVIRDIFPEDGVELAIWFDPKDPNAVRAAKRIAVSVVPCKVRITEQV